MSETVAELVLARASNGDTGLLFEDGRWSWAEVVRESQRRAGALTRLGREGPFHVGVLLENVPEYVFVLFGAALAGATVVGINPTRRGEELARDIRHTDCQMVLTDRAGSDLLEGLDLGMDADGVIDVESAAWTDLLATADWGGAAVEPEQLYVLLFTSGSTGAPKAVRMSQGRAARTAADSAVAFGPGDVLYCAMPLFHGNALLANLLAGLVSGATVALRRRFSASAFGPDIRASGATFFNYVGRALSYILAVPEQPEDADNRLKWALGSEASLRDRDEFTRRFGCPIFEGYGSSENAVVISPGGGMPAGALGKPRRGSDVIVANRDSGEECPPAAFDPDGRLANPGEAIGEIVGRNTAERFEGYYNNPEAEAERLRSGWYWTGDLGYRDAEGWFWFAGRTADWLRVDGENFAVGPVERILERWEAIRGVAVYAVPDPVTGDQVMAAIETEEPAGFDVDGLTRFLGAQPDLGTKWAPRFVRVLTHLPLTASGKVDKVQLRRRGWDDAGPLWWRPPGADGYRPITEEDRTALITRFRENHRDHLLAF
ncbi:MAG TPA: AMP-binding protein [Acidimicrobiales bacterium]|nr:AMP-binding protein [Acidimicrobiales bacterium]